jgi:DNA-binding response OmpR family regulator
MRILVVDDNPDIRVLLVSILQRAEYEVIEASDGISVQTWVKDTQPDLTILDLLMPELDGWETLKRLKSDPSSKDIPVIISSALSDYDDLELARSMGAIDYIPKPWSNDDLLSRIRWATTARKKSS